MRTFSKIFTVTLIMLAMAACSNKVAQSKKYFRIPVPVSTTSEQTELKNITLVIKRPKALSILGGRPMVATQDDESLVQLSHHFWIESPKVMLQDILKNWAAKRWQSVSYQTPNSEPYQILDSRIISFEKRQGKAKIAIEFTLYNEDYQIIYDQQFEQTQVLEGDGYRAFSKAVGKAIATILDQLSQQL